MRHGVWKQPQLHHTIIAASEELVLEDTFEVAEICLQSVTAGLIVLLRYGSGLL